MEQFFARIDERLIHGQIMTSWIKTLGTKKILIIDDETAKDDFMSQVLIMSAPSSVDVLVMDVEEGVKSTEQIKEKLGQYMLLFKNVACAYDFHKKGGVLKELNVGNIGSRVGRDRYSRNVCLTNEEHQKLKDLEQQGVNVYLQMLPSESKEKLK